MDTITLTSSNIGDVCYNTTDGLIYTVNDNYDWITISDVDIDINSININGTLFEDYMPEIGELKEMCAEYPGLEKAYENFKTFYKLVEQDWRGKQKLDDN